MRSLGEIVHLRTGECRMAADVITQVAAGEELDVEPDALAHVRQCLRCQAEVAAYRRVLRVMRAMASENMDPPPGAAAGVIAALGDAGTRVPTGWAVRMAYLGGITVATAAAGAAGVLMWISRKRVPLAS